SRRASVRMGSCRKGKAISLLPTRIHEDPEKKNEYLKRRKLWLSVVSEAVPELPRPSAFLFSVWVPVVPSFRSQARRRSSRDRPESPDEPVSLVPSSNLPVRGRKL